MRIKHWNDKCDEIFQELKTAIATSSILDSPDWKKSFRGHVDACEYGVGGTVTQLDDAGKDHMIAVFSKKLSPSEQSFAANDR